MDNKIEKDKYNNDNKFLPFYRSFPLKWAKHEYSIRKNDRYRITTIDWSSPTNKLIGKKLSEQVHKKIYEIPLEEFNQWFVSLSDEEEVLMIERISE